MSALAMMAAVVIGADGTLTEDRAWTFKVTGAGAYQFDADLDDEGDFSVLRAATDLSVDYRFSPELSLDFRLGYGFDGYDFSEATSIGADPWEDIHTLGFGAHAAWKFAEDWSLHVGGLVAASGEDAEWSDAVTGGGVVAVTWRVNERLLVGAGVGGVSRIEDDPQIFPVVILEWGITDNLRLTTASRAAVPSATSRGGLELVFAPDQTWEIAVGGRYDVRRFRLDDEGVAPEGVGEDESLPLWVRVGHRFNDNIRVDLFAGFTAFGELSLNDEDGHELADDDYDPAAFVGGALSIEF
jgi:hypothetical protein